MSGLVSEWGRVLAGKSELAPARGDRRFADPAWQRPVGKRLVQGYLAACREAQKWIDGLHLEGKSELRARFLTGVVLDALSPANSIFTNPAALERARATRGKSLLRGLRNFISDLRNNGGMPSMIDKTAFELGKDLATTPGDVVFRNEVLELIQFRAQRPEVHARPLFIAPPQINRYYVLDLSPENSIVGYLVRQGFQPFVVSWRNPGPEHRDWGLGTYVAALEEAAAACCEITGSGDVNWMGLCAGGITSAAALSHFAASRSIRVNSLTLAVTMLDMSGLDDTALAAFVSRASLSAARESSRVTGVLEGSTLARTFAWIRANDLIWNYWVSNYLMGGDPLPLDVLHWNANTTRLPARLHSDFVDILENDALVRTEGRVDLDKYVIAGETDHITPWRGCYRSARLVGGRTEFALCNSGHVQTLLAPPGNPKARYATNAGLPESPDEWLRGAKQNKGSWWEHWTRWLAERSGERRAAPAAAGSKRHPSLGAAPGRYVLQ